MGSHGLGAWRRDDDSEEGRRVTDVNTVKPLTEAGSKRAGQSGRETLRRREREQLHNELLSFRNFPSANGRLHVNGRLQHDDFTSLQHGKTKPTQTVP